MTESDLEHDNGKIIVSIPQSNKSLMVNQFSSEDEFNNSDDSIGIYSVIMSTDRGWKNCKVRIARYYNPPSIYTVDDYYMYDEDGYVIVFISYQVVDMMEGKAGYGVYFTKHNTNNRSESCRVVPLPCLSWIQPVLSAFETVNNIGIRHLSVHNNSPDFLKGVQLWMENWKNCSDNLGEYFKDRETRIKFVDCRDLPYAMNPMMTAEKLAKVAAENYFKFD